MRGRLIASITIPLHMSIGTTAAATTAMLPVSAEEGPHALHAELVDVLVSHIPQISDDIVCAPYEVVESHPVRIVDLVSRGTGNDISVGHDAT